MDTLPVELRSEIGNYLTFGDLKVMRLLGSTWNSFAKYTLQSRRHDTVTFNNVNRLTRFNDTFAIYEPMGELDLTKFRFLLPLLASEESSAHLDSFVQTFGQSVTSLNLRFQDYASRSAAYVTEENVTEEGMSLYWFMSREREVIDRNVTLLLAKVKGHLETLELKDYIGMSPCVLGSGPFPALSTLKVDNIDDLLLDPLAIGRIAAIQESCLLELSTKVPTIQDFDFRYNFGPGDDPSYLSSVLRNLLQANPEVRCKLSLRLPSSASRESLKFVQKLSQAEARISELCLSVPEEGVNREDFRLLLEYVRGQSNSIRKLTLVDSRLRTALSSTLSPLWVWVRLPRMRVLEVVDLTNVIPIMADNGGPADYLPSLRRLSMDYWGNDLTVTLPSVTDLTLVNYGKALDADSAGEDFQRLISNFPNLRTLNCPIKFLALPAIFSLVNLTHLKIRDHGNIFWNIVTEESPRLTFDEIVDLDVTPAEAEGATFEDLGNLRELIFTVVFPVEEEMNAVLYVSKVGKLQRLQNLIFETGFWAVNYTEVTTKYLQELRKYHDSVEIISNPPKFNH